MNRDTVIEIMSWIITIILLIIFVPRKKIKEAQVIFFFKQLLTWPFGLVVSELGLVEYPVRFFPVATRASFTFEYFVYPAICVLFNLYYPFEKGTARKLVHYFIYTTGITVVEEILQKYTDLIKYVHWAWYWTWVTLLITFFISNKYYRWFYKL